MPANGVATGRERRSAERRESREEQGAGSRTARGAISARKERKGRIWRKETRIGFLRGSRGRREQGTHRGQGGPLAGEISHQDGGGAASLEGDERVEVWFQYGEVALGLDRGGVGCFS